MTLTVLHAATFSYEQDGEVIKIDERKQCFTKRYFGSVVERAGASNPKYFRLGETYDPPTLEDLYDLLTNLGDISTALVIRYKFKPEFKLDSLVSRRSENVIAVPSRIIALDIDGIDLPERINPLDVLGQGEYVCGLLNSALPNLFPTGMGYLAQASSSAGFSGKIKLHLWLMNQDPLTQLQIKAVMAEVNKKLELPLVDLALYSTVQPHYTAYPIFKGTLKDPFEGVERSKLCKGNVSLIPESYASFVQPVKVEAKEIDEYLSAIHGSLKMSDDLSLAVDKVMSWKAEEEGLRKKVIACYHSAVQNQFDLESLGNLLFPIVDMLRPGKALDYIEQGKAAAVAHIKACSKRELPAMCMGTSLLEISGGNNSRFLNIEKHMPDNSLVFLKAALGTGKTHTIASWLNSGRITGKFLAITDTSALVESNAKRFGAGDYRYREDLIKFQTGELSRLSGTIHSLQKLENVACDFDFVFIDEADSVINNLLFASIIEENKRIKIIEVLSEILRHSNVVILSDGDLSEETVMAYTSLSGGKKDLCRINHHRQNLAGVRAYKHRSKDSLWGALDAAIALGEKCLLVSDSSPDTLNTFYKVFERKYPSKRFEVIHADSKQDENVRDIVNFTTHALKRQRIDALLCSPSITNGVDFNYFNTVFVLTGSDSHTPNLRFQALMRERQPKEIHYYFTNHKGHSTGYANADLDNGWISKYRKLLATRREKEFKTYIATFNYYLVNAGATVHVVDDPYSSPRSEEDDQAFLFERANAILKSTELFTPRRHNDAYEMKKLIKALYHLQDEPTLNEILKFLEEEPHKKAEFLHKIAEEYWELLMKNDPQALGKELKVSGYKFYLLTGCSLRTNPPRKILNQCGITPKCDIANVIKNYITYCHHFNLKIPKQLSGTESIMDLS